jgi:hypothetical protein
VRPSALVPAPATSAGQLVEPAGADVRGPRADRIGIRSRLCRRWRHATRRGLPLRRLASTNARPRGRLARPRAPRWLSPDGETMTTGPYLQAGGGPAPQAAGPAGAEGGEAGRKERRYGVVLLRVPVLGRQVGQAAYRRDAEESLAYLGEGSGRRGLPDDGKLLRKVALVLI